MRLRWLTVKTHVDSTMVREYATVNSLSMMQAKKMLENECGPRLQYCPEGGTNLDWTDVPYVTEYREHA